MAWEIMTVTTKGTELLASASASDQLTIVGCDADTTVYSTLDSAKAVSTRPVSPLRNTTDVTILFTQNNNLFSRAYFGTGTSATSDVNTLYLYGKLDSSEDIYVVAVASSSITTHLPVSGDPSESFQALFNFMYNVPNTAAVTASSASFATIAELNDLASRVVTTNIQGSTTTGENQTIRGEKTFLSRIIAANGITSNAISYIYGALNIAYSTQSYMLSIQYVGGSSSTVASQGFSRICTKDSGQNDGTAILRLGTWGSGGSYNYYLNLVKETRWQDFPSGFYWDFGACGIFREGIRFDGVIAPDAAATQQGYANVKIGIASAPITEVHAKEIKTSVLLVDEIDSKTSGNSITLDGCNFSMNDNEITITGEVTVDNNGAHLILSNEEGTIEINNDGDFSFSSTQGNKVQFNGGVEFNPTYSSGDVVFSDAGFKIKTTSANSPVIISATGITVGAQTFNIGSNAAPVEEAVIKKTYVNNVSPFSAATAGKIGARLSPYTDVYANNFHGLMPYPTSSASEDLTVPIGGIIVINGVMTVAGRTFDVGYHSKFDGSMAGGGPGLQYITAGTYVALSSNSDSNGSILAMRIA